MKRKYIVLAAILFIFAFGLVILPGKSDQKEITPEVLLASIAEKSRYLSVDQITHRIIEKDPALLLIDLRPGSQFKTFTLPGAINVSPDSLLTSTSLELLRQPGKDKVLFSNSDRISEIAWVVCSRLSMNRIYIMKGGMNEWFNTIIRGTSPNSTPSSSDLDLISFRNAARQIFAGTGVIDNRQISPVAKEKISVIKRDTKVNSGGGC